jgi:hypothetical protein
MLTFIVYATATVIGIAFTVWMSSSYKEKAESNRLFRVMADREYKRAHGFKDSWE